MKQAYKRVVNDTILFRFKVVMVSGAILFILGHYLLDQPIYPGQAKVLLLIRIAISSIFAAGFLLSFFNPFKRYAIWMANAWMVMAGAAICLMIGVTDGAASDYYEGLNLVFLAMLVMNSFYFTHSLGVGGIILALYAMASWGNLSAHLPHALQVTFFSGSTLFFVCLMTKLYGKQHYNEFKRTEQVKQSAKELDEANKKLKETEKLKDEFFANVSHELRTPLTLTLAPLESWLGGEYGACSPEQRNALETMHHNAVRLLQMVNSLLDFSKLEAGKLQANRQPTDLNALVQDIVEEFKPLARRKGLALRQKSLPSHIFVDIDVYLYDRILFNLLSNAVKFTPQGGTISLSLTHKNQRVALRIQDSGIGIPPEELPKLFQKFRQVEGSSTRRYEGTGLGLALVKEFARLLEGDVRIESPPGQGTTVTVDCFAPDGENSAATAPPLPAHLSRVPSYDLPDPGRSFEPPSQADSSSLLKVLVVEDNAELSAYIAKLISPFYQVKVVADGELALSSARDWLPDLILSDVMMPKRDGFSLCTALKAEPETAKIPVILLTALTHREAMLKGWEVGADEYLFKPFHPKELLTRVRSILSSAQVKQDARKEIVLKNRVLEGLVRTLKEAKEQLKNERDQLREANKAMDRVKSRAARLKQEVNELRQSRQSKAA